VLLFVHARRTRAGGDELPSSIQVCSQSPVAQRREKIVHAVLRACLVQDKLQTVARGVGEVCDDDHAQA